MSYEATYAGEWSYAEFIELYYIDVVKNILRCY